MAPFPHDNSRSFVIDDLKKVVQEVYKGAPQPSPYKNYDLGKYIIITHGGITEEGMPVPPPSLHNYNDALAMMIYQTRKYCANHKRAIIRTYPEINKFEVHGDIVYSTYFRLFADNGINTLDEPNQLIYRSKL